MLTRRDELISRLLTRPYLQVSVNEAAAQICRLVPAMLTRRDELFPLARQVVRDSGYQYSKGHSRYCIFVLLPAMPYLPVLGIRIRMDQYYSVGSGSALNAR